MQSLQLLNDLLQAEQQTSERMRFIMSAVHDPLLLSSGGSSSAAAKTSSSASGTSNVPAPGSTIPNPHGILSQPEHSAIFGNLASLREIHEAVLAPLQAGLGPILRQHQHQAATAGPPTPPRSPPPPSQLVSPNTTAATATMPHPTAENGSAAAVASVELQPLPLATSASGGMPTFPSLTQPSTNNSNTGAGGGAFGGRSISAALSLVIRAVFGLTTSPTVRGSSSSAAAAAEVEAGDDMSDVVPLPKVPGALKIFMAEHTLYSLHFVSATAPTLTTFARESAAREKKKQVEKGEASTDKSNKGTADNAAKTFTAGSVSSDDFVTSNAPLSISGGTSIKKSEELYAFVKTLTDHNSFAETTLPEVDPLDPHASLKRATPPEELLLLLAVPMASLRRFIHIARCILSLLLSTSSPTLLSTSSASAAPGSYAQTEADVLVLRQFLESAEQHMNEGLYHVIQGVCRCTAAAHVHRMSDFTLPNSGSDPTVMQRSIVAKGHLVKKFGRGKHERLMFCFTDALVYCEEVGGGKLRVRGTIPFVDRNAIPKPSITQSQAGEYNDNELVASFAASHIKPSFVKELKDIQDNEPQQTFNCFEIVTIQRSYVFFAASNAEKRYWLKVIAWAWEVATGKRISADDDPLRVGPESIQPESILTALATRGQSVLCAMTENESMTSDAAATADGPTAAAIWSPRSFGTAPPGNSAPSLTTASARPKRGGGDIGNFTPEHFADLNSNYSHSLHNPLLLHTESRLVQSVQYEMKYCRQGGYRYLPPKIAAIADRSPQPTKTVSRLGALARTMSGSGVDGRPPREAASATASGFASPKALGSSAHQLTLSGGSFAGSPLFDGLMFANPALAGGGVLHSRTVSEISGTGSVVVHGQATNTGGGSPLSEALSASTKPPLAIQPVSNSVTMFTPGEGPLLGMSGGGATLGGSFSAKPAPLTAMKLSPAISYGKSMPSPSALSPVTGTGSLPPLLSSTTPSSASAVHSRHVDPLQLPEAVSDDEEEALRKK